MNSVVFMETHADALASEMLLDHARLAGHDTNTAINADVVHHGGAVYTAFRGREGGSYVPYIVIDGDQGREAINVAEKWGEQVKHIEDVRLAVLGGIVHAVINTKPHRGNHVWVAPINGMDVGRPQKMLLSNRGVVEKNWSIYEHGQDVFAIHSISPLRVLKLSKVDRHGWHFKDWLRGSGDLLPGLHIGSQPRHGPDGIYFTAHRLQPLDRARLYIALPSIARYRHGNDTVEMDLRVLGHNMRALGGGPPVRVHCRSIVYASGLRCVNDGIGIVYTANERTTAAAIVSTPKRMAPADEALSQDEHAYMGVCDDDIPSRGLGDTIAKATKAVGIKPCGGCKKRQKKLNQLIPYKGKHNG